MKLYTLSGHPNKPCSLLHYKGISILLDCALNMGSVLNFLPLPLVPSPRLKALPTWIPRDSPDPQMEGELKDCSGRVLIDSAPEFTLPLLGLVDMSEVDVILVSNYMCMLALPYLTAGTGFKGVVYATEPTQQIGRLYMEELVHYVERSPKSKVASRWKEYAQGNPPQSNMLPSSLREAVVRPKAWKTLYSTKEVEASLTKIQTVGFNEKIDVFGTLEVMPVSSGYCLGSCNWIIGYEGERVAYVSGSSTLTTHPRPMDQQALRGVDLLLLTALTQTPVANPDSMLGEFCLSIGLTVRSGGNVLVPCYPSGVVYDLFECLSAHLDSANLSNVPLFFVSPVAESSLAYSNILAEWLSEGKQNKVYLPEEPFPHASLMRSGRLKHFPNLHAEGFSNEFRQPCVVFCGHPSLRFGDIVHFLELWGSNPLNTIVFTEPDFPYLDALSPYQPLAMKIVHCPIDTSLNFSQANKLIRELRPKHLMLPRQYTVPPTQLPHRTDLLVEKGGVELTPFQVGEVRSLPGGKRRRVGQQTRTVLMHPDLAVGVVPIEVRPGVALATITGELKVRDNKYTLKVVSREGSPASEDPDPKKSKSEANPPPRNRPPKNYPWGQLDVDEFVRRLAKEGLPADVKAEPGTSGRIIHLQSEDTVIQVGETSTHIFCEADESVRKKLRNILVQCLKKC